MKNDERGAKASPTIARLFFVAQKLDRRKGKANLGGQSGVMRQCSREVSEQQGAALPRFHSFPCGSSHSFVVT